MQIHDFKNKHVLVMGLGLHGGGVGAAKFFARLGARVLVTDLKTKRELAPSIAKLKRYRNISYHLGGHRISDFRSVDYVIKNPGVPERSPFLKAARKERIQILSDVEVFFRFSPAPIIGITGTKGKSTTTWLIGQVLKIESRRRSAGRRIWVGGNIRKSVLEFLPRVRKNDLVVLELSSFQLDSLAKSRLSPETAIITNIFPDHLNRYDSMVAYAKSKAQIFRFQKKRDLLVINQHDATLRRLARSAPGKVIAFDPERVLKKFSRLIGKLPTYHRPNIAAAIVVARSRGVGDFAIRSILKNFHGIPNRMELIRTVRGVEYINDTTATNPGAAEAAVRETKKRIGKSRRLQVIAGGYDKRLPDAKFIRALTASASRVVFLPGTASDRMRRALVRAPHRSEIMTANSMEEAVRNAASGTKNGDVVLLSPGAASFGLFTHEFDRGDQFVRVVRKL